MNRILANISSMKCICPYYAASKDDIKCIYKSEANYCEDIDVCPKNGDAWCVERKEEKNSE